MKIYTKGGDQGNTSLYSGQRVRKDSLRVEAYGTIDELQSVLGLARSFCSDPGVKDTILKVEQLLVTAMAEVSTIGTCKSCIGDPEVKQLEEAIDRFYADLPPMRSFILPGESQGSAALHVSRTVARRAERLLWRLSAEDVVPGTILLFFNRLSDLCFALARYEDERTDRPERIKS